MELNFTLYSATWDFDICKNGTPLIISFKGFSSNIRPLFYLLDYITDMKNRDLKKKRFGDSAKEMYTTAK